MTTIPRSTKCRRRWQQPGSVMTISLLILYVAASAASASTPRAAFRPPAPTRPLFALPGPSIAGCRRRGRPEWLASRRPPRPARSPAGAPSAAPDSVWGPNEGTARKAAATAAGDYLQLLRPVTLLQAVGALVVGRLALTAPGGGVAAPALDLADALESPRLLGAAAASLYLSYGAGMVANDCVDFDLDASHVDESKRARSVASGRVPVRRGWQYSAALSVASLGLGWIGGGAKYALWTASNLALMLAYALGLQRVFLLKNVVVGYLSVSPLVGAALLPPIPLSGGEGTGRLWRLASVGFPLSVAREILKDLEDVESDLGRKRTLPHVVGEGAARGSAFALVWLTMGLLCTRPYWSMFASQGPIPWYAVGHVVGAVLCARANSVGVREGQRVLKKAIYVLLGGMIAGLLT